MFVYVLLANLISAKFPYLFASCVTFSGLFQKQLFSMCSCLLDNVIEPCKNVQ